MQRIKINGKSYQMSVRRVDGNSKLFFKTNVECYNAKGFAFPYCRCGNIQHRLESWKNFKKFLIKGYYPGYLRLNPEPEPNFF